MSKNNTTTKENESLLKGSKPVLITALACVIVFMGLGLVDPILSSIAASLKATATQTSLLFTSYLFVTAIAMIFSGSIISKIGSKNTMILGVVFIAVFSFLCGTANNVWIIVFFRACWGFGNAMFISTALSSIIYLSPKSKESAIVLYEGALGIGLAVGPLLGGILGNLSWRYPFFGVAVLMVIELILLITNLPYIQKPEKKITPLQPIKALRHKGLRYLSITALFYNFGMYGILGYTPFALADTGIKSAMSIAYIFFAWGILLFLVSVIAAPKIEKNYNIVTATCIIMLCYSFLFLLTGNNYNNVSILIFLTIISSIFLGLNNTFITTMVMEVSPYDRSVASSAYNFIRFIGGAFIPVLLNKVAELLMKQHKPYAIAVPFLILSVFIFISLIVLFVNRSLINHTKHELK